MNISEWRSAIEEAVAHDTFWASYLAAPPLAGEAPVAAVHLAVFVEPYLGYVLDGTKTVESRFSENCVAPYGSVHRGDVILLKESGGDVVGICRVDEVWSYRLQTTSWKDIRNSFARAMCAEEPEFWEARARAKFATLMRISNVLRLPAISMEKSDRRGWVVLSTTPDQLDLVMQ